MENYLIERDVLAKIVDGLLATKFPDQSPEELIDIKEENIKKLDDHISDAIFGSLSDVKLDEINSMLDRDESDPRSFRLFFRDAGVDLEQAIADAIKSFSTDFLGGQNA